MGVKVCVAPDAYRPGRPKRKSLARGVGERSTFLGVSQQLACQAPSRSFDSPKSARRTNASAATQNKRAAKSRPRKLTNQTHSIFMLSTWIESPFTDPVTAM